MRFIFRADASRESGSGHVMRSSVIAEEAISRGIDCIFLGTISGLDWVSERIANLGFSLVTTDVNLVKVNSDTDVLILDSYSVSVSDPFIAKKNWKFVLSICDAITPKYDVDIQLRPVLSDVNFGHEISSVLSGADYVLIRRGIRKSTRRRLKHDILKLLVVGGGSDPFGFVPAVAKVLTLVNIDMEVHFFTDSMIQDESALRFVNHRIGPELDSLAGHVDVVFTTASTSSLEFIAREIPTGIACAVDNQLDNYDRLGRLGYASQLGTCNASGDWNFNLASINEMLISTEKQESLRTAVRSLIDLRGASRVVDTLILGSQKSRH
jgi:spore coat polysaccharide biosynthesis predicted glycosyltransferase SpsG